MVVRRCDICGCELRDNGTLEIKYKAKKWNFFQGWEEVDICNFCLDEIERKVAERRKKLVIGG